MIDASKMMNEFEDMDRRLAIMQSRLEAAERELAALREQTRWRKYPDEKPKARQRVQVMYQGGHIKHAKFYKTKSFGHMGILYDVWMDDDGFLVVGIVGWRPIPEPPEDANG